MDLTDRNRRNTQMMLGSHKTFEPLVCIHNLFGLRIRQYLLRYLYQSISKREQDNCGSNIKNSMHICNLRSWISRIRSDHPIYKRSYHTKSDKNKSTNHIEHQMDGCSSLCVSVGSHRSQNCGDTGTNILSE